MSAIAPVAAVPVEHSDAELLELCAKLADQARAWQQLYDATPDDYDADEPSAADEELEAYSDLVWPGFVHRSDPDPQLNPLGQLCRLPAHTAAGRQARAGAVWAVELAQRYVEGCRDDLTDLQLMVVREAAGDAAMKIGREGI